MNCPFLFLTQLQFVLFITMKLTQITVALAALLSTVVAQSLSDLPNCAVCCFLSLSPENKLLTNWTM